MQRKVAVIAGVLLLGYALYGAMFGVGLAVAGDHLGLGVPFVGGAAAESGGEAAIEFDEVAREAGLNYSYAVEFTSNQEMVGNAGMYAADYDGDGWTDLLAVGGEEAVLFENRRGEFHRSGALPELDGTVRAALFFDREGDGTEELLLLRSNHTPTVLALSDGTYNRVDAGFERPLDEPIGATAGDYDGDGCTDLFVIQYGNWSTHIPTGFEGYDPSFSNDTGNANRLYEGNCSTFSPAADTGIRGPRWSLAASSADLDNDGDLDIHVANDFNYDVVYVNRGNGSFEQRKLGERTNRNGMSSEIADVNRDGRLDMFVTNIFYPQYVSAQRSDVLKVKASGNNLLVNRGNATFEETAKELGVNRGGWGWAAAITDLDNDGDEDLFHATREISWNARSMELSRGQEHRLASMDIYSYPALWSYEDGSFTSIPARGTGLEAANGRGVARLDYDRDGRMDLAVATTGAYRLYENTGADGRALQLRVRNNESATAVGARVYLRSSGSVQGWRSVRPFTDFLSQDAGIVHFGTGDAATVSLRVKWPDGTTRVFEGVRTNRRLTIEPSGIVASTPFRAENATATE